MAELTERRKGHGLPGLLACARPDPTIGWTDVLPCVFVCVWGRYPPAAALLVRRLVVPVLNKLLQLPLHPLAGAWRVCSSSGKGPRGKIESLARCLSPPRACPPLAGGPVAVVALRVRRAAVRPPWAAARLPPLLIHRVLSSGRPPPLGGGRMLQRSGVRCLLLLRRPLLLLATLGARTWRSSPSIERLMAFRDFLDFLEFLETSEVAGPGPNPREIEISFGAEGPLACDRGPWARQEHLLPAALRALSGIYANRLYRPSSRATRRCASASPWEP